MFFFSSKLFPFIFILILLNLFYTKTTFSKDHLNKFPNLKNHITSFYNKTYFYEYAKDFEKLNDQYKEIPQELENMKLFLMSSITQESSVIDSLILANINLDSSRKIFHSILFDFNESQVHEFKNFEFYFLTFDKIIQKAKSSKISARKILFEYLKKADQFALDKGKHIILIWENFLIDDLLIILDLYKFKNITLFPINNSELNKTPDLFVVSGPTGEKKTVILNGNLTSSFFLTSNKTNNLQENLSITSKVLEGAITKTISLNQKRVSDHTINYVIEDLKLFNQQASKNSPESKKSIEIDYGSIEEEINKHIFGQPKASNQVSMYLKMKYLDFLPNDKGTVLTFMGPTGVGKSEMAKIIAKTTGKELFELACGSDLKEKSQWNSIIGSSQGYLDSNKMTPFIRFLTNNPDGILVLDEFDQSHIDVQHSFYKFFDDSVLRDGMGELIKDKEGKPLTFNKLTIILTTNAGEEFFQTRDSSGKSIGKRLSPADLNDRYNDITPEDLDDALRKKGFKDAFIARQNYKVLFNTHTDESLTQMVNYSIHKLSDRLMTNNQIKLTVHDSVLPLIINNKDINFELGARPVKNLIESLLTKNLATFTFETESKLEPGDEFTVKYEKSHLIFSKNNSEEKTIFIEDFFSQENSVIKKIKNKLPGLENYLKSKIIGQDFAIEKIVESLYRNTLLSDRSKPIVFGFFGGSGVGKKEIIEGVADYFFGDEITGGALEGEGASFCSLQMSGIKEKPDLNRLLGADRGYKGYEDLTELQKHLKRNPKGGVISLNSLEKSNLDITTPFVTQLINDGKVETGNENFKIGQGHIIFITGDLLTEKFPPFVGEIIGSEEIALSLKKLSENKIRNNLTRFFKPSIVAAMDTITLVTPLSKQAFTEIYSRLVNAHVNFIKTQFDLNISIDDSITKLVFETGYSHDQGILPLENIIKTVLTDALLKAKEKNLINPKDNISINYDPLEKKIFLISNYNKEPVFFVKYEPTTTKVFTEELLLTAYHEAGHAVTHYINTGGDVEFISIKPHENSAGMTLIKDMEGHNLFTRKDIIAVISSILAGRSAELYFKNEVSTGASNDIEKATSIAIKAVTQWGLSENLSPINYSISNNKNTESKAFFEFLSSEDKKLINIEIKKIIDEANELSLKTIKKFEPLIEEIVGDLLKQKTISKEEFLNLIKKHKALPIIKRGSCETFFANT